MSIREMTPQDFASVQAVVARNGLTPLPQEQWEHRWRTNPAAPNGRDIPRGWVVEDPRGQVVGTFSNVPVEYCWNGRRLLAGVASAGAVDVSFRKQSLSLHAHYFAQRNVDFLLNTTANEAAAGLWKAFGAQPIVHAACDRVLMWITRYSGFLASCLRRCRVPGAAVWGGLTAGVVRGLDWFRSRHRLERVAESVRPVPEFDARFDALWDRLQRRPNRLLAVRDRRTLSWHFKYPILEGRTAILVLEQANELAGYVVLLRQDCQEHGLKRLRVIDFQVAEDVPGHVEALLAGALQVARTNGVHVVEVIGLEPFKRHVLENLGPHLRSPPSWAYWYKPCQLAGQGSCPQDHDWDPSPFDGDASL